MMPSAVLMILTWYVNYFLFLTKCPKINSIFSAITLIFGCIGAVGLMGVTATIDTGKHNVKWHINTAKVFFIVTILAIICNTILSITARKINKMFTATNCIVKISISVALILMLYRAVYLTSEQYKIGNTI
jgi:hypothetical protein